MSKRSTSNRITGEPATDLYAGETLRLVGGEGSPYSNKMKSLLHFRRIPFRWLSMAAAEASGTPNPRGPNLAPKLLFPDDRVMNDSTMLIKELERLYPARSVIPDAKGLAFVSSLLEDFFDEWLTKAMFHYRWTYDVETAGFGIGHSLSGFSAGIETIQSVGTAFGQRQVGRMDLVGSNAITGPIIEQCFERLCKLLEKHFESGYDFLLGSRPSAADFALYGQLHPMISLDIETSQRVFKASRTLWFWYHSMKDLSGRSIEDPQAGWISEKQVPHTINAILREVGRFYAPFMVANKKAIEAGEDMIDTMLDGGHTHWTQPSFKYQAKCLSRLREEYAALNPADKEFVDATLSGTGCVTMFQLSKL